MTATNPFLSGNFAPVEAETTCFDLGVHGRIPEGLDGRFLRIGPNPIGPVDPPRFHWFLGTGMAHGLRLRGGRAEWYRGRFVLSARAAEALGRAPIPGPGAGRRDGEVNTHFTTAAGKLYALVEAGNLPVERLLVGGGDVYLTPKSATEVRAVRGAERTEASQSSSPSASTDAAPPSASKRREASHRRRLACVSSIRRRPPWTFRSEITCASRERIRARRASCRWRRRRRR
jgi:hypothetical protein